MKTVMLVLYSLGFAISAFAQRNIILWPTDTNTDRIIFSESVSLAGKPAAEIFKKAKDFTVKKFAAESDTVVVNEAKRTVSAKGRFVLPIETLGERGKGYISYLLIIWCHRSSYKYAITDLEHVAINADGVVGGALEGNKPASGVMAFPIRSWNDIKAKTYYRVQTLIEDIKRSMSSEATE